MQWALITSCFSCGYHYVNTGVALISCSALAKKTSASGPRGLVLPNAARHERGLLLSPLPFDFSEVRIYVQGSEMLVGIPMAEGPVVACGSGGGVSRQRQLSPMIAWAGRRVS